MAEAHVLERLKDVLFLYCNSILFRDFIDHITCDEANELSDRHLYQFASLDVDLCHGRGTVHNLDQVLLLD